MKLEAVGRISVCDLRLEIRGQIDDRNGSKWALLRADTTSNAQILRYESDFRGWFYFDTKPSTSHNWARFFALLSTFLRRS